MCQASDNSRDLVEGFTKKKKLNSFERSFSLTSKIWPDITTEQVVLLLKTRYKVRQVNLKTTYRKELTTGTSKYYVLLISR